MSKQLQAMLLGGLITLNLFLAIVLTTLVISEWQPVQASVTTVEETIAFESLTDAPQRNINQQEFVPLQ